MTRLKSDLTALGLHPALADRLGLEIETLAGVGTSQSGAAAINKPITLGTTASGQTAFVLPSSAELLEEFEFTNTSSTAALLFPPSGGAINGGSTNASISVAQNQCVRLRRVSTTSWRGTLVQSTDFSGITATVAEINKLDDSASVLTPGSGIAGIAAYASGVFKNGDLIVTRLFVDLTDLVVDDADLDIIGDDDAANAHFGQITAALNGTIIGGQMTCLEVPAGAGTVVDIDLYAADEGTGTEGVASGVASLTETALVTSGGSWTINRSLALTGLPAADQYLYLVAGAAGGDSSAFTAGKFLIELYGV